MRWPNDADGDVLRSLEATAFDFSKPTLIDFNVDFQSWPPPADALKLLSRDYPSIMAHPPQDDDCGYLGFQVYALVTYELVTNTQTRVTEMMAPFKGECSSWGVWGSQSTS